MQKSNVLYLIKYLKPFIGDCLVNANHDQKNYTFNCYDSCHDSQIF